MKKMILAMVILASTVGLMACNNNRDNSTDNRYTDNRYTDHNYTENRYTDRNTDNEHRRPENPAISLERAIEIAYEDLASRNIAATFQSDSGMEWEQGQWVWELLFTTEAENMPFVEYYISVDDGSIVKFEWDD